MKILAAALLILGSSAMMGAPARAIDAVMPPPVTDVIPPEVSDGGNALPSSAARDTDLQPSAPDAPAVAAPPVAAEAAAPAQASACIDCSSAKRYDSLEVIRKIQEIDRSRRINTTEIAPPAPPLPPAERPSYRIRSDVTLVNFVVHRYRLIEGPELVSASEGDNRPVYRPEHRAYRPHHTACKYGSHSRYNGCRPRLRVRG